MAHVWISPPQPTKCHSLHCCRWLSCICSCLRDYLRKRKTRKLFEEPRRVCVYFSLLSAFTVVVYYICCTCIVLSYCSLLWQLRKNRKNCVYEYYYSSKTQRQHLFVVNTNTPLQRKQREVSAGDLVCQPPKRARTRTNFPGNTQNTKHCMQYYTRIYNKNNVPLMLKMRAIT